MSYFQPTSSERRGILVLCVALVLLLGVCLVGSIGTRSDAPKNSNPTRQGIARLGGSHYYAVEEKKVETFDFDPNTADSTMLLRLGFPPFMVHNIYKYRARGGRYHEPEDLRRVYGMTNELWDRLASHVRIDRKYQYVDPMPRQNPVRAHQDVYEELAQHRDTVRYPQKLEEGSVVAVNHADTNALKKIPGIGSYYARRIVRYREELGGYVSLGQLQEIEGIPEDVEKWLRLDSVSVRRIDVNHATKNQLVRHPYLRVYRARAIWDRRHNFGPLHSLDDLRALPDFTEADLQRLAPYLEFRD